MLTFRHLRPRSALLALALYGSLSLLPSFSHSVALAQTRPQPGSGASSLEARLDKATRIYNAAMAAVNSYPVFQVSGRVVGNRGNRLVVYGTSSNSTGRGLGWNGDDTYLTVNNADLSTLQGGRYFGNCVALSQTEFSPAPKSYYDAVDTANKYAPIVDSLQNEIVARDRGVQQAALRRQQMAKERLAAQEAAKRESVLRSRVVLATKEREAAFAQSSAQLTKAAEDEKPRAYLQSATRLTTLFNKWASLGADDGVIVARIVRDLLGAATAEAKMGDMAGASTAIERLLSLELQHPNGPDPLTARPVVVLAMGKTRPSAFTLGLLHYGKAELPEVRALADAWLEQLPQYMKSAALQAEKARVAALSQVLVTKVFAPQSARLQVVGTALESLRGGRNGSADVSLNTTTNSTSVAVDPALRESVEAARRKRVEGEVEAFLQRYEPGARTSTDPQFFRGFANAARSLAGRLAPHDEFANLDAAILVAGLRAATLWAGQGKITVSMEDARGALWDSGTTAKMVGSQKRFSPEVQTLLESDERARQTLGGLLGAWTTAFPIYTKSAEYTDSLQARKFGEVLLRCSAELHLPQMAALETVLKMPIMAPTAWMVNPKKASRVDAFCAASDEGDTTTDGATDDTNDQAPPKKRELAPDLVLRSLTTMRKKKLSDFQGKVVVLYFWDILNIASIQRPTPEEQLSALAKKYDPKKVVLLLVTVGEGPTNDSDARYFSYAIDAKRAEARGRTPFDLPKEAYVCNVYDQVWKDKGDRLNWERPVANFYRGSDTLNVMNGAARVTVLDAEGKRVGQVDFEYDRDASEAIHAKTDAYKIFDFDEDALDRLIVDALIPADRGKNGEK